VKVPLASKDELVRTIGEQLVALAADPGRCVTLGEQARVDALGIYGWDVKARKTIQAYERALGRGSQARLLSSLTAEQTRRGRPA
jgi:hypothetical protein